MKDATNDYFFGDTIPITAETSGVNIKPIKKIHSSPSLLFLPILSATISAPAYQIVKTIKKISSCILVVINEQVNKRNQYTQDG